MSGLEIVKIIVDSEKEAGNILVQAEARALEIRKQLDDIILREREEKLSTAKREATSTVQKAEMQGKSEAFQYEKESEVRIKVLIENASAKKIFAVKALSDMILR
ncbi:MAG TPA: hypothetical protein VJZ75_01085 [Candidatus Bathyarchaeia archaeon]|nr:hypothetical protein [Candidatus Bathyarchaeia archaeon]